MSNHYHSIFCILPPHMLQEIIEHGTPMQRRMALKNLTIGAQVRGRRHDLTQFAKLQDEAAGGLNRTIYDAQHGSVLPGKKVRGEGDPPVGDPAVEEAYDGAGITYQMYKEVYGRDSIDGRGMPLNSTVHYLKGYDNAFWNGEQMVYGDGDEDLPVSERLFNRFSASLDIMAHELTHGVIQAEAGLVYRDEPGALNESMADVFGSLVKQRSLGQDARSADWIIGEGLLTSNVNGVGLRSMKAPGTAYDDPVLGKDPQPSHMADYKSLPYDNGGVHINSGIPNHAFYVAAYELGGRSWEKMGRIWYVALCDKLNRTSQFQAAADITLAVAGDLYGRGSLEQGAVAKGWQEVGIIAQDSEGGDGGSGGTPSELPGCLPMVKAIMRLRG